MFGHCAKAIGCTPSFTLACSLSPTGAAHKRAFRRRASSSPSGGSAASGFYQFASSFAGLPQYSGKNGNYASATAKANPTFHNGGQQQQRPLTVPQSQIGASPSVSESTASPQTARPLTKRYGAYHDIGDDAASYGTQQATDAVASVSNMLYGDDYAWGLAKRQSAIPSPTSAGESNLIEWHWDRCGIADSVTITSSQPRLSLPIPPSRRASPMAPHLELAAATPTTASTSASSHVPPPSSPALSCR